MKLETPRSPSLSANLVSSPHYTPCTQSLWTVSPSTRIYENAPSEFPCWNTLKPPAIDSSMPLLPLPPTRCPAQMEIASIWTKRPIRRWTQHLPLSHLQKRYPCSTNHVQFPVLRHGSRQYNISSTGVHCHATIKIYYQNTRNSFGAIRLRHVQPECINLLPCQQYDAIHAQWRIISLLTESEEPRWRFFLPQRQTRQYSKNPISPLSSTSQYSLSAKSSVTQWSPLRRPRLLQFSSPILRQYPTEALSQNLAILNLPHLSKLTIQPVLVSQMIPQNKNAPSPSICASTAYRTAHHKANS